jgi:hypothetical protein
MVPFETGTATFLQAGIWNLTGAVLYSAVRPFSEKSQLLGVNDTSKERVTAPEWDRISKLGIGTNGSWLRESLVCRGG